MIGFWNNCIKTSSGQKYIYIYLEYLLPWGKPAAWYSTTIFIIGSFLHKFFNCSYFPHGFHIPFSSLHKLDGPGGNGWEKGQVFGFHSFLIFFSFWASWVIPAVAHSGFREVQATSNTSRIILLVRNPTK